MNWVIGHFAFTLIAALILLKVALRGVPVDGRPLCRKCGFDLTGKPADSTKCAECGLDVSITKNVTFGHRRKSIALLLFALLGIFMAGRFAWDSLQTISTGLDWRMYKATWWVLSETRSTNWQTRHGAWDELFQRLWRDRITRLERSQLIERALSVQNGSEDPWYTRVGEVIEKTVDMKWASQSQSERYFKQALNCFEVKLRPKIGRRESFWPHICTNPRTGWTKNSVASEVTYNEGYLSPRRFRIDNWNWFEYETKPGSLELLIDNKPIKPVNFAEPNLCAAYTLGPADMGMEITRDPILRDLADGTHLFRMKWIISVYDLVTSQFVVDVPIDIQTTFDLLPEGQDSIQLVHDPRSANMMSSLLSVQNELICDSWETEAKVIITQRIGPIPAAYRIRTRAKGVVLDPLVLPVPESSPAGAQVTSQNIFPTIRKWAREPVDIVFEPSLEVASRSLTASRIWGDTYEIKGLRLDKMPIENIQVHQKIPCTQMAE